MWPGRPLVMNLTVLLSAPVDANRSLPPPQFLSLANAEMRTILARLVYNFDMELVDPNEDWLDQDVFFLWKKPPLNVYLTPAHS